MTRTATIAHGGEGGKSLTLTLPAGDLGTDCTIMAMRAVAEDAAQNSPAVAALTKMLDVGTNSRGHSMLPRNLYDWLRAHVRFKRDGRGLEHIRHPDQVLAQVARDGIGTVDCDCLATLAVAVLLRGGLRPAFIVVGRRPAPAEFQHVFYGVLPESVPQWRLRDGADAGVIPFDPQERTPPGLWPEGVQRFRVYPV